MEKEVRVEKVEAFRTKSGNVRYVLRDEDGSEYTTFREEIARDALEAEGGPARIEYHEQRRDGFTNVYLDVGPVAGDEDGREDGEHADEVAWKTAVEATPWLVGQKRQVPADELFGKLKPFKDRVADDIRADE